MGAKLFQKKDDTELRKVRVRFWTTAAEKLQIKRAAAIRSMDESEFLRRAALGRRADVDYETEIVLALSDVTRTVRAIHSAMVERGISPPESELLALILEARAAIQRVSK